MKSKQMLRGILLGAFVCGILYAGVDQTHAAVTPASIQIEEMDTETLAAEDPEEVIDEQPETVTAETVTGLKLQVKKQTVVLNWEAVPCSGYAIYRREKTTGSTYQLLGRISEEQYADQTAALEKNYDYRVTSYMQEEDELVESEPADISYLSSAHLPKLSQLKTDARSGHVVELYWTKNRAANQVKVYRRENGKSGYRYLGVTDRTSYLDRTVQTGRIYTYKVVPCHSEDGENLEGTASTIAFYNVELVDTNHQNYTYSEMKADLKLLEQKYSRHCRVDVIGSSVQNRKIYDVVIGNPDAEKSFLVVSALHAREYITCMVCMEQIEYYLKSYNQTIDGKKVSDTLENVNIHYVVMANPDGVTLSQTRSRYLKNNARNINLNANYPDGFKAGTTTGRYAGSEPETKAIMSLCTGLSKNKKLQGILSYHAMGQIVFGRYAGSNGHVRAKTNQMYWVARNTTGYADEGNYYSNSTGKASGSFRDYALYTLKVPCVTVEVGSVSCPVPYYYMPTIWRQNRNLILREAALFR